MPSDPRPSILRFVVASLAWVSAFALYANSLFDLNAAPTPPSGNPLGLALSDLARALTEAALPALWLLAFAVALILARVLLPPSDHGTLRWLRQAWVAALVSYVGGLTVLPRGLLLIDVLLLCGSIEGTRVAVTSLVHRLSTPLARTFI